MLTIITVSHKNPAGLAHLWSLLGHSLDEHLRWRVKDSGACSETRAWAAELTSDFFAFDDRPDTGIYEALNQALSEVQTPFYLVVGSDDAVDAAAIRSVVTSRLGTGAGGRTADVLTFPVATPLGLRTRKRRLPMWVSSSGLTSSHSIGTVIRRALHDRFGLYDTSYRILADSLFLRRAHLGGARFEHFDDPVLGTFSLDGVSSRDHGRRIAETYTYLCSSGASAPLQAFLMLLRICRYRPRSLL